MIEFRLTIGRLTILEFALALFHWQPKDESAVEGIEEAEQVLPFGFCTTERADLAGDPVFRDAECEE